MNYVHLFKELGGYPVVVELGSQLGQKTRGVELEDLYRAFKSRLMAELKADRQGDLYERPEGDDE